MCDATHVPLAGFITVADAAQELGISRRRVLHLMAAGILEGERLSPRFYLVDRSSVERYKHARRPAGRPPRRGEPDPGH